MLRFFVLNSTLKNKFNWWNIPQQQNQNEFRWTLDKKIAGLATTLLVLLGGVSSYFYFEINEISREIEEIAQSDFPIYETTTQLVLLQKEKLILLEELNYIYRYSNQEQSLYFPEIADKLARLEQDINQTLFDGIEQSQFALEEEKDKEDKFRLNQDQEDYQKLKEMFLKLELKNQKSHQIIEQAISQEISLSANLIQQARLELQVFDELTQEIIQTLKVHIDGSVSATIDEKTLAIKTNALIAFGALLFGFFFSTTVTRQITSFVNQEILERQQAEDRLKSSLTEKEILLKEIYHRVKNNLLVVSSLLEMQTNYVNDPETVKMLKNSKSRIHSMALVHEQLYRSDSLKEIDLSVYIKDLSAKIFDSHSQQEKVIDFVVNVENISLNIETAHSCGLILNELITNALEHAFTGRDQGTIWINLLRTDDAEIILTVKDDGIGVSKDFDFYETDSLGLKLVRILTRQLEGEIKMDSRIGSSFQIKFSELDYCDRF